MFLAALVLTCLNRPIDIIEYFKTYKFKIVLNEYDKKEQIFIDRGSNANPIRVFLLSWEDDTEEVQELFDKIAVRVIINYNRSQQLIFESSRVTTRRDLGMWVRQIKIDHEDLNDD